MLSSSAVKPPRAGICGLEPAFSSHFSQTQIKLSSLKSKSLKNVWVRVRTEGFQKPGAEASQNRNGSAFRPPHWFLDQSRKTKLSHWPGCLTSNHFKREISEKETLGLRLLRFLFYSKQLNIVHRWLTSSNGEHYSNRKIYKYEE